MMMLNLIRRMLLGLVAVLLLVSYWQKNNYRSISDINSEIINNPSQEELADKSPIIFTKNGYRYELTPLYKYKLEALVVHEMSYDVWYSLSNYDTVFPKDVCAVWGRNIAEKIYRHPSLKFSQDYRFCNYRAGPGVNLDTTAVSNTHLIANSDEIIRKIKKIKASDQVKIEGKLVNVKADFVGGEKKRFDFEKFTMNTSIVREDSGAGACEILYVEKLEILKNGNPIWKTIFAVSSYAFGILILWGFIQFFWEVFFKPVVRDEIID
jgi:hypothetical protein